MSEIVASLVGHAAVLTATTGEIGVGAASSQLTAAITPVHGRYVVPDAPPPRI